MKLSMSLLAWYLRKHDPICYIVDDKMDIGGLRFVMDDVGLMEQAYVYFGEARHFFDSGQYKDGYLAVNRHSMLLFLGSDYNILLNEILSGFEFFNRMEGRLLAAATSNAPLETFFSIMEPILENPFRIANADWTFELRTDCTGHETDPLWLDMSSSHPGRHPAFYAPYFDDEGRKIQDLSEQPVLVQNVYPGGKPVMMLYLQQAGEYVGGLAIFQEKEELTQQNMQLAPIFAKFCTQAAEFVHVSGAMQASSSVFQNLLEGKDVGKFNLQKLAESLPPGPWRLLRLHLLQRTDRLAQKALLLNLRSRPALQMGISLDGAHFALMQESVFQDCMARKSDALEFEEVSIGASMPFVALSSLALRRQQAEFSLAQSARQPGIVRCEDYAFDFLIRSFREMEMTESMLHPALESLAQYDRKNQGELRETLSVYLQQERNQILAAQALHIHPNTLRYRLQRIQQITGVTLHQQQELNYLRLSDWLSSPPHTAQ